MPLESLGASNVSLRTKSREFAMQMLFQWDMSQQDFTKLEVKFWKSAKAADKTRAFANKLFEGAAKDITALDAIIVKHADNWRFERRSEEHTSELQSRVDLVCRLLLEKKKKKKKKKNEMLK